LILDANIVKSENRDPLAQAEIPRALTVAIALPLPAAQGLNREIRNLIRQVSHDSPLWGALRIRVERHTRDLRPGSLAARLWQWFARSP
jgi:hypothetical protein